MSNTEPPERESKGLGKRLGNLLKGDKIAGTERDVKSAPRFGRGMETLLNRREEDSATDEKASRILLPAWFFFSADLLLLGYTVAVLLDSPRPYSGADLIFCAGAVTVGCVMGLIGVARCDSESPE